jgi:hypothetical protein
MEILESGHRHLEVGRGEVLGALLVPQFVALLNRSKKLKKISLRGEAKCTT